jgi:hypothetical protein
MKIARYIKEEVESMTPGVIFVYKDLILDDSQSEAVVKSLNRLVSKGVISKLSKGKFYKPTITPFGAIPPSENEVVKDLLEKNGKIIGYLTGYSIFNRLGLTTQLSNTITIGRNDFRPKLKRGIFKIEFVLQKNIITRLNIPLLQLLDSIKLIKQIPDTSIERSCERIIELIKELDEKQCNLVVNLSMKYPPSTRALLGALMQEAGFENYAEPIKKTLNPLTMYKLEGINSTLSSKDNWNFK